MSGKALKRNSYWLMERNKKQTDVEKIKLKKYLQLITQVNIKLNLKVVVLLKRVLKKLNRDLPKSLMKFPWSMKGCMLQP